MKDLINTLMFYVVLKQSEPESMRQALEGEGNDTYTWIEDGQHYMYQTLRGEHGDFLMRITPPPIHIVQEKTEKTEILIKRIGPNPLAVSNGEQSSAIPSGSAGNAVQTN